MRYYDIYNFHLLADFWSALGGKKDYQTSKSLQKMVSPPRLFGCSNKTGRLIVSQIEALLLLSPYQTNQLF